MKDIAIFGAGGLGREIACLIHIINKSLDEPRWNLIGFFDDNETLWGNKNEYGIILGGKEILNDWKTPIDVAIAIGTPRVVKIISEALSNPSIGFPNIISPSVTFLDKDNIKLGRGNIICTNCMVSTNVTIGDFNIFNGYIPIGHDTVIGNCNVIMPSVNISGGVIMGDCNFIGVQSVILQYIKMGNNVRVGANSVIMRTAKDGYLYMGNPAKKTEL